MSKDFRGDNCTSSIVLKVEVLRAQICQMIAFEGVGHFGPKLGKHEDDRTVVSLK